MLQFVISVILSFSFSDSVNSVKMVANTEAPRWLTYNHKGKIYANTNLHLKQVLRCHNLWDN